MKPEFFRVIFNGQIAPGADPAEVKNNLSRLFKLDPAEPQDLEKLKRLFSGNKVIIKDKLSLEAAENYRRAIKNAGALCEIKPVLERRQTQRRVQGDRRAIRRTSSIQPDRRKNGGRREADPSPDD